MIGAFVPEPSIYNLTKKIIASKIIKHMVEIVTPTPDGGTDQGQRRPIYPQSIPKFHEQTEEELKESDRIKSIDSQLFGHIYE